MQLQANLTMESTKKSIQQREVDKEQHQELQGDSCISGHAVMEDVTRRSTPYNKRTASQNSKPFTLQRKVTKPRDICTRCGRRKQNTLLKRMLCPEKWFATDATGKATSKSSVYPRLRLWWRPQMMTQHSWICSFPRHGSHKSQHSLNVFS